MEKETFDAIARRLGGKSTRRQALWSLRGAVLAGMASSLGWADGSAAGGRRRKRRGRKDKNARQKGCRPLAAPCPPCHEPRCDPASGEYACHYACAAGSTCCNGRCKTPCANGCELDRDQSCSCEQPPAGMRYCAARDMCVSADCPSGTTFDAATCRCLCPDAREICPADTQCCAASSSCTHDGCCEPDHLCERNGVMRCCY